MIKNSM